MRTIDPLTVNYSTRTHTTVRRSDGSDSRYTRYRGARAAVAALAHAAVTAAHRRPEAAQPKETTHGS